MVVPITQRYGIAGPSGAIFGTKKQQVARDPRPSDRTLTPKPEPTPPPPPTDWTQWEPKTYPTALPSLSAAQLGQLSERRRLADEAAKSAQQRALRGESIAEASALASRQAAERSSKRGLEEFMREAGGKGLARQPMIAGRQVRVANEDLRLKYGEISGQLSSDLMALQDMVDEAMRLRDTELARIEQDRVNMQANLERLFPAGSMYRG